MARSSEIRYINFFAEGSAARVLEPAPKKHKKVALPQAPKKKVQTVHVDVMAIGGLVMAAVLMITMVFGLIQLRSIQHQKAEMECYVYSLQNRNAELRYEYENSYNLEEIRMMAESMGYVPAEEVKSEELPLTGISEIREATVWERIMAFFTDLFA